LLSSQPLSSPKLEANIVELAVLDCQKSYKVKSVALSASIFIILNPSFELPYPELHYPIEIKNESRADLTL